MHEQDITLIRRAKEFTTCGRRTRISDDRRRRLTDAIESYVTACDIALGPDEQRSAVWSKIADECWTELSKQLSKAKDTGLSPREIDDERPYAG